MCRELLLRQLRFNVAALIHVCVFCGVRFSSPRTLQAHIANYCSRKPFAVTPAPAAFNPAAAAAATALAGALAIPPPPVLFTAPQSQQPCPSLPGMTSRDVNKYAPAEGEYFRVNVLQYSPTSKESIKKIDQLVKCRIPRKLSVMTAGLISCQYCIKSD